MSSTAATWLHGQRKSDLVEMAKRVGLKDYEPLRKNELETALDEHMRANSAKLSKDDSLSAYYKRIAPSPVKDLVVVDKDAKTPAQKSRRKTITKSEIENDTAEGTSTAVVARTPKEKKLPLPASVPLPPSPAVIAEQVERQIQRGSSRLRKVYRQSGVTEQVNEFRDRISTTMSIETLAVALEVGFLLYELFPFRILTTIPAQGWAGLNEIPVKVPDLFLLLTLSFWQPVTLWAFTNVGLPLLAAFLFNPTLKAKHGQIKNAKNVQSSAQWDPLTLHVAKALVVWLVYVQEVAAFGFPAAVTKARVISAVPGGYQGVFVTSAIGTVVSLYEAVLRK